MLAEKLTKRVLKEFLVQYGKDMDIEREEKRTGKSWRESAPSIVADYDLPLTATDFSNEIMPLFHKRQVSFSSFLLHTTKVFCLLSLLSFFFFFFFPYMLHKRAPSLFDGKDYFLEFEIDPTIPIS